MSPRPPKKNPYARTQIRTPEPAVKPAVRPAPVAVPPAAPPAPPAPEVNLVVESVPASAVATAVDTTVDTAVATVTQPEHQIFRHLTAAQVGFCRTAQSKVGVPANILAALALLFLGVQAEESWLLLNENGYARGFTLTPRAVALQRMVERGL